MKRRLALTALLLLAALTLSACASSKADTTPTVQPIPVAVTKAETGRVTATSLTSAQIEPALSLPVTAKVGGRVVTVHKEMGDTVAKGDLLITLEDRDPAAHLAQARASLAQAEAQRAEAARQAQRIADLLKAGAVSKQQAEQVETQLALATAQATAARAQVDLAQTAFEQTRITAPADGVLAARLVEPGALLGTGTAVFQLVDLSTVVVRAGVAERDINSVRPGATVPVRVAVLDREFTGTIEAVSPNMDRQTRSYQVKVSLPNPDGLLKGGMFAQVRFAVREEEGLILPVDAIIERSGESFVYVVEGESARLKKVTVTVTADATVAVEGLESGATVVVVGQNRLFDGAPVRVKP